MSCADLSKNVILDCDFPMISGANDRLLVGNRQDIVTLTRNVTDNKIIEGIALASGANLYIYEGKNSSIEPRYALRKRTYSNAYEHEVRFKVFKATPAVKDEIENMAGGDQFAIIENNYRAEDGSGAFELYGYDTGLELLEMERVIKQAETQGAFDLMLKSNDDIDEPHLPLTLFLTDYDTTKAFIDAIIADASANI